MERVIQIVIDNAHYIINVVLLFISMRWVNYDFIIRAEEFWQSIKGKDKILQITEMCIYVWIRIIPIVLLCDLFLGLTLAPEAWYSLDAIFFTLILGDLGHAYIQKTKDGKAKNIS